MGPNVHIANRSSRYHPDLPRPEGWHPATVRADWRGEPVGAFASSAVAIDGRGEDPEEGPNLFANLEGCNRCCCLESRQQHH